MRVKACGGRATILGCMKPTVCRVNKLSTMFSLRSWRVYKLPALRLQRFNRSYPFLHLLRKRALRAIGIVLHTEIFIDLKQTLLIRDGS